MPDQDKKVYCELSGREERYLNMYGPHSPANSDSPLSLVVRKEDHRKLGVVDSPGRSSGEKKVICTKKVFSILINCQGFPREAMRVLPIEVPRTTMFRRRSLATQATRATRRRSR